MTSALNTPSTPLVRTAFGDDSAWQALVSEVETETADGFRADVSFVDDPSFANARAQDLAQAVAARGAHAVVLIADEGALNVGVQTLLCVSADPPFPTFRVSLPALWMVENNLSIANMDFEEFTKALDEAGVFRGF